MHRRQLNYLVLRGAAAVGVVSSTLLPRGLPAALVCVASGVLAVLTCVGVNAGADGERAGARAQARAYDRIRPPQGQWPPYDDGDTRVVDGELVRDPSPVQPPR